MRRWNWTEGPIHDLTLLDGSARANNAATYPTPLASVMDDGFAASNKASR